MSEPWEFGSKLYRHDYKRSMEDRETQTEFFWAENQWHAKLYIQTTTQVFCPEGITLRLRESTSEELLERHPSATRAQQVHDALFGRGPHVIIDQFERTHGV